MSEKIAQTEEESRKKEKMDFFAENMKRVIKEALKRELGSSDESLEIDYRGILEELYYREFPEEPEVGKNNQNCKNYQKYMAALWRAAIAFHYNA